MLSVLIFIKISNKYINNFYANTIKINNVTILTDVYFTKLKSKRKLFMQSIFNFYHI